MFESTVSERSGAQVSDRGQESRSQPSETSLSVPLEQMREFNQAQVMQNNSQAESEDVSEMLQDFGISGP